MAKLGDQGVLLCGESTVYRLLRTVGQQIHRNYSKAPQRRPLTSHHIQPAVVRWHISWMPITVEGRYRLP